MTPFKFFEKLKTGGEDLEKPDNPIEQQDRIEENKREIYKDKLLENEEALLYQDYATKLEGKEFSDKADEKTYEEADELIKKLRRKEFDFLGINWNKIDLKDAVQKKYVEERLDATIRMLADSPKGASIKEKLKKIGNDGLISLSVAIGIILGANAEAANMNIEEDAEKDRSFDIRAYMPYRSADGHLSWKALLEPFAVAANYENKEQRNLKFDIPYEYARLFDTGQPLKPEDYDKLNRYIEERLQEELRSNIYAFSFDKKTFQDKYPDYYNPEDIKINSITIIGSSSPEASKNTSEVPGAVDKENINLSNLRADDAGERLQKVLEKLNIDFDKDSIEKIAIETQFSDPEFEALQKIADDMGLTTFELIKKYNNNSIEDQEIKSYLDTIIAEKRKVGVMIEMKDGGQKIIVIPLPLLAILMLAGLRGGDDEPDERAILSTESISELKKLSKKPELEIPAQEQILEMYKTEVLLDIAKNPNIYIEIANKYKDYDLDDKKEAINVMTYEVLDRWMEVDNKVREDLGQGKENYYERPHQILYAKLHAAVVMGFTEEIKNGNSILSEDPVDSFYNIKKVVDVELEQFREEK